MKFILLNLRGLGDSLIMINALNKRSSFFKDKRVTIITWDKNTLLYSKLTISHNLIALPIPKLKKLYLCFIIPFKLFSLFRYKKFDFALNFSGDFKENFYLLFIKSRLKITPFWEHSHLFNSIITQPFIRFKGDIFIPKSIPNIYDVYSYVLEVVFNSCHSTQAISHNRNRLTSVALFPFASQKCREWPLSNWDELAEYFILHGYHVYFVLPVENFDLISTFSSLKNGALIFSDVSNDLFELNRFVDFSICLDSFSSHFVHFLEIPSLVIYGASVSELFGTPSSMTISNSGNCSFYPCYNKPKCIDTYFEYNCLNKISVDYVVQKFHFIESELLFN